MVLNKIFLTEQLKKKVLKYNVENNNIIKYLSDLEIDKIKKKHHVNLYFRLKRYLKILILKISGFLSQKLFMDVYLFLSFASLDVGIHISI